MVPVRVMLPCTAVGNVEPMLGTPEPSVTRMLLVVVARPVTVLVALEYRSWFAVVDAG